LLLFLKATLRCHGVRHCRIVNCQVEASRVHPQPARCTLLDSKAQPLVCMPAHKFCLLMDLDYISSTQQCGVSPLYIRTCRSVNCQTEGSQVRGPQQRGWATRCTLLDSKAQPLVCMPAHKFCLFMDLDYISSTRQCGVSPSHAGE
jgi:hypothetical protein